MKRILYLPLVIFLQYCQPGNSQNRAGTSTGPAQKRQFSDYWHQGKAEITSYTLQQARYGQLHAGESVLIFVTEDFSRSKNVKLDNPEANRSDAVNVLKLNLTKKFTTGIYPYSMMLSTFTPVYPEKAGVALKATASVQEWCGHTFSQLDLDGNQYRFTLHSYFEREGEQQRNLPAAVPEDELWSRIRINPGSLPLGNVQIIPSLLTQRLRHTELQRQEATATLQNATAEGNTPEWLPDPADIRVYQLQFPEEERTLTIYFRESFPHVIEGWEETYKDGSGPDAPVLSTRAVKNKSMLTDYWTRNRLEHASLRDSLGLRND
jgi:hypothetical protein